MARFKGSTLQLILLFMLVGSLGCDQLSRYGFQKRKINATMLLDCSSSVSIDRSSLKQGVVEVGRWWAKKAERGGGRFEVLVIGNGIDDLIPVISKICPDSFPYPTKENRREWKREFEKELQGSIKELPSNSGSAILEGIFRATNRLNETDGDKVLIVYSDLRQVTPGVWNFERSIPEPEVFRGWAKEQYLVPAIQPETRVVICGFKPYQANSDTSKITPVSYGKLREFWLFLFKEWSTRVSLSENFNPKDLEVM